jgi:hypothetical protein
MVKVIQFIAAAEIILRKSAFRINPDRDFAVSCRCYLDAIWQRPEREQSN